MLFLDNGQTGAVRAISEKNAGVTDPNEEKMSASYFSVILYTFLGTFRNCTPFCISEAELANTLLISYVSSITCTFELKYLF